MAKKGRINKAWRNARDAARSGDKPEGLIEPTGRLTPEELERRTQIARASGAKGAPARINRERELKRRDRNSEW